MSKKVVEDFLKDVKKQKVEQLLGIALDKSYWQSVAGDADVDELRKELSAEKAKMVSSAQGKIIKDNRDLEKIVALEARINVVEKANQELARLGDMEKNINIYLAFVVSPDKGTMKTMEEVAKM